MSETSGTGVIRRHSAPKMDRPERYRHQIATVRKNSVERLEVFLNEYNGVDLSTIAVVRDASGKHKIGGMRQTSRFVSFKTALLPRIIQALQEANARAIAEGILTAEEGQQQ